MNTNSSIIKAIIKRVIIITLILIGLLAIGVKASNSKINTIKIVFSDDCEISVMTGKTLVSEILEENHIILMENETVYPELNSNIDLTKTITITKGEPKKVVVAEETANITEQQILGEYVTIVEKIIVEQEEIPFETVVKDNSSDGDDTTDKVLQEGENGIREVKYKVKYQNDVEIERIEISSEIIQEPVDRIVQISKKITSRYGDRSLAANASNSLAASVADVEPKILTMNASAYTASTCGKSPSDPGYGRTSSGAYATSNYTLAAGSGYPIGTVIYIPYFANEINGGWFVVQDRGGAISNNRIDIYMDTYEECISFGRRNLECYVYE